MPGHLPGTDRIPHWRPSRRHRHGGGDIFGDGVNVAARLEALAEPGGICVSARVQEDAAGKLDLAFNDIGEHSLKNIARPIRVYRVAGDVAAAGATRASFPLPDKPSLAVLPFQNMSGDPEQDYFADGMVEDITAALCRVRDFFVIARNSAFSYKGRAVAVQQISRELGVRYLIEGSVRRSGNRIRITAQLIDGPSGNHLWADRYEGPMTDVFDLQDRITESVVGAIQPSVRSARSSGRAASGRKAWMPMIWCCAPIRACGRWSAARMPRR